MKYAIFKKMKASARPEYIQHNDKTHENAKKKAEKFAIEMKDLKIDSKR